MPLTENRLPIVILALALALGLFFRLYDLEYVVNQTLLMDPDTYRKIALARKIADGQVIDYFMQPYFLINTSSVLLNISASMGYSGWVYDATVLVIYQIVLTLLTSLVIYASGSILFRNRTIAALGATIFLVSPIGIVSNHYVKEDVPVMFMTNLVMLLILMLIEAKKTALYLLTGIVSGIAIGTKIIATSLIPIVLFAHVLSSRHPGKPIRKYATRNFGLMLALIPVGFFLVNPQILFQFGDFLSDYRYQLSYAVSEHHDGTRYSPWDFFWSFQFRYGLVPGFSAVIAVAGLLGIFLCLRNISCSFQKNKPLAIYIVWVVGFYLLIESSPIKPHPWQVRYVLPAVPGFSLFAGYAIFIMARYLGKSRIGLGGASFAVLLILLVPITHSAIIVSGYKTDTIEVGRKWVRENLSSELKIVEDSRDKSFTDSKVVRINSGKRPCGLQKPIEKQAENFTNDIYVTNSTRWIRYFRAEVNNTNNNADCYRWIFDRCPLIWEIGPEFPIQSIGYHNPQIKIFDLRQCRTNDRY